MGVYKIYNKMYEKGKPVGRAYYTGKVVAKSATEARKKSARTDVRWNTKVGAKRGYQTKVFKVTQVRKRPTVKRTVRRAKPKGFFDYDFNF